MTWRVVDLCSGAAGGWSLGLHRAGMKTVAACEAVAWRRAMFAANNPGVRTYDDLRTLGADTLERDLGELPDIIVGSPPCKEYSEVNSRGRGLDGDDLFLHAVRIVDESRPRWAAFENSPRLRTRGYDRIAGALEAIGYTCWPFMVQRLGARHRRGRSVIIAADLSRPQRRPAGQPREHVDVGGTADLDAGRFAGRNWGTLGPVGTADLGRHLREYDGVSAGVSEQCREAYGDAVFPQLTEAVGRAILQVEAALALDAA